MLLLRSLNKSENLWLRVVISDFAPLVIPVKSIISPNISDTLGWPNKQIFTRWWWKGVTVQPLRHHLKIKMSILDLIWRSKRKDLSAKTTWELWNWVSTCRGSLPSAVRDARGPCGGASWLCSGTVRTFYGIFLVKQRTTSLRVNRWSYRNGTPKLLICLVPDLMLWGSRPWLQFWTGAFQGVACRQTKAPLPGARMVSWRMELTAMLLSLSLQLSRPSSASPGKGTRKKRRVFMFFYGFLG